MNADTDDFGLPLGPTYDYDRPRAVDAVDAASIVRLLTAVGAFAVGIIIVVAVSATRDAARVEDLRRADLIDLIGARQERADELTARLEELRAEVAAAQEEAAAGLPALTADLAAVEAQAGLTALEGTGVRLTLADAGDRCTSSTPQDCRILDADVQLALNTLFGAGAEAIAVNEERVIATTAVRSAGSTILVNYRPLTSPYTIDAVGNPKALADALAASTLGRDFALWTEQFGLGYDVEEADELVLPAHRGGVSLRTARVAGGPG